MDISSLRDSIYVIQNKNWGNNGNMQYQKTISSSKRIPNIMEKNNCLKEWENM
jgi:hypothetical protein